MIRLIGWDMDGVLIDSLCCMQAAWRDVQDKFNLSQSFVEYQHHIGKPFEVIMLKIGIEDRVQLIKSFYVQQTKVHSVL